jgi:hypothetical protein
LPTSLADCPDPLSAFPFLQREGADGNFQRRLNFISSSFAVCSAVFFARPKIDLKIFFAYLKCPDGSEVFDRKALGKCISHLMSAR